MVKGLCKRKNQSVRGLVFVERDGASVTRSFRLDKALDVELNVEADEQGASVSNLLEKLVEEYLNHQRWVNRANALTILIPTMQVFLKYLENDELVEIGETVGGSIPKQEMMMRGIEIDEEVAKSMILRILGGHDKWFTVDYHEQDRSYYFIRNSLGEKWVIFVEAYIRAFYRDNLGIAVE